MPAAPFMGLINLATEDIKYKTQLIARDHKLSSGLSRNTILGIVFGLISAVIVMLPFVFWAVI